MRIMHTSDWHVGRSVTRGGSREEEHRAVFSEMAEIVAAEKIELILIAGDIYDTTSPSAASEDVVYQALLGFTRAGAKVALIAGNHDHPERLHAVTPLLELAQVRMAAKLRPRAEGGCIDVTTTGGEVARIAMMPWLRRSNLLDAATLMMEGQDRHQSIYAASWKHALRDLTSSFSLKTVNLVMAHVVFAGAVESGSERQSETIEQYWVPPEDLEARAHYIALGHIHKPQKIRESLPAWYCGSPLQLDFGEGADDRTGRAEDRKCVLLFEASPGARSVGQVREVPLSAGRRMRTLGGTLEQLKAKAGASGNDYLRIFVREPLRAGLAEEVRDLFPDAVEVRIDAPGMQEPAIASRRGKQPRELLAEYFEHQKIREPAALDLFDELLEEEHAAAPA